MKKDNSNKQEIPYNSGTIKSILMNDITGENDNNSNWGYLKTYHHSLNESKKLLNEAIILFKNKSFERAYFLGFSALEEISKSQLAADVFTGLIEESEFKNVWRDHKEKIKRVKWIQIDANEYPYSKIHGIEIKDFDYAKKLNSMYVDYDFISGNVSSPSNEITEDDAQSVISAAKVGLHRIHIITEEYGGQIGTKGFMK